MFLSARSSRSTPGLMKSPNQLVQGALSPGIRRSEREAKIHLHLV
jgi:hypothetical protein